MADYRRQSQKNRGEHYNPKQLSIKGGLQLGAANPYFSCGSSQHLFKDCTKKGLTCNTCKRKGHLAHMCNKGGASSTANAQKAFTDCSDH